MVGKGARTSRSKVRMGRLVVPMWAIPLAAVLVTAAVGQAVGPMLMEAISGNTEVTIEQAFVIDRDQFTSRDVTTAITNKVVTFNDEGTAFTVAAEFHVGNELVLDVPLINKSGKDLSLVLEMQAPPPLIVYAEAFWTTETIPFSRTSGTIVEVWTTPSPAPFTQSWEQAADTTETTTAPPGLSGSTASRIKNLAVTNSAPTGAPAITAQSANGTATTTRPSGAPDSRSGTWYTGVFLVDLNANADGIKENVYFVLTDNAASGVYNTMDISTDNDTFGETLGGLLNNGMTGPRDDERITATTDVRLGAFYTFTVAFDSNPAADNDDARLTAKTWFIATVTGTDLDGDGAADDTFYVVLTDNDSDGIYEKLDLSIGDNVFGEGNLGDLIVDFTPGNPVTANTNDERLTAASDTSSGVFKVKMGTYTFTFSFDTTPGGGP